MTDLPSHQRGSTACANPGLDPCRGKPGGARRLLCLAPRRWSTAAAKD